MTILESLQHQLHAGHPKARQHALTLLWELPPSAFEPDPLPEPKPVRVLTSAEADAVGHALRSGFAREVRRGHVHRVRGDR